MPDASETSSAKGKVRHQTVRPAPCAHGSSSQILMHMGPVFGRTEPRPPSQMTPLVSAPHLSPAGALSGATALPVACAVVQGLDNTHGPEHLAANECNEAYSRIKTVNIPRQSRGFRYGAAQSGRSRSEAPFVWPAHGILSRYATSTTIQLLSLGEQIPRDTYIPTLRAAVSSCPSSNFLSCAWWLTI
jgi:hypothetical protein